MDFDRLKTWSHLGAELDKEAKAGAAEDRHGAAVFWLLSGYPDHGINKLRALLDEHPENGRIRADLVAAYLLRAEDQSHPLDGIRALEIGLHQSSSSLQLRTNLLIALHRLGFRHLAAESLELLATEETDPAWTDWLDGVRQDLEKPSPEERWRDIGSKATAEELQHAAEADPLRAYDFVETLWLRAALSEKLEEVEILLNAAEAVGLGLVDARPKVWDTTSRLRKILEGGGEQAERLRAGLDAFRQGRALYDEHNTVEASQNLSRAANLLDDSLPLLAKTADLLLAHCEYRRSVPEGIEALQHLQQTLDPFDFPHLAGRAAWILGSGRKTQRRYQEALDHYRLSRPLLKRASGPAEAPFINLLIAETLDALGDLDSAWRQRAEASAAVAAHAEPERRTAMLMLLSWALADAGFEHALLASLQELAAASASVEQPYWQANAHLYAVLSRARLGRGRLDPSFASVDAARAAASAMEPGPLRTEVERRIELARALDQIRADPSGGLERLQRSVEEEREAGQEYFLVSARAAMGSALLNIGRPQQAVDELLAAVEHFEKNRASLLDPLERRAASRAAQQALEAVLGLDVKLDEGERFRLSEKLRAWEWRQGSPLASAVPTPSELAELLPEEVAVVHFTVLGDRLETWWIEPGSVRRHIQALDRSDLKRRIERLEWALDPRSSESELYEDLDWLYQLLIQPLPAINSGRQLIFIPDGTLSSVPFPALHDAANGRFLIEKHPVAVAPGIFLVSLDRKRPISSMPALLIAADSPSPSLDLPDLPWAAQGIREIAALHPAAEVMIDPTASDLLPRLAGRPLVHFAGHALMHPTRPELTRLALAGNTESEATITLAQAVEAGLADAELVALSACRTMDHALEDRDVTLGAAGFLVGRGVATVLAAGQDVSDPLASWLMPRFYAARIETPDASEALHRAVLELLSSGPEELRSPAHWGILSIVRAVPIQQPRRPK